METVRWKAPLLVLNRLGKFSAPDAYEAVIFGGNRVYGTKPAEQMYKREHAAPLFTGVMPSSQFWRCTARIMPRSDEIL
jgi:hypothetical protein